MLRVFDSSGGGGVATERLQLAGVQANLAARGLKSTGLRTQLLSRMKLYVESKRQTSLAYMATEGAFRQEEVTLEQSGR
jgi:hypothetical protein